MMEITQYLRESLQSAFYPSLLSGFYTNYWRVKQDHNPIFATHPEVFSLMNLAGYSKMIITLGKGGKLISGILDSALSVVFSIDRYNRQNYHWLPNKSSNLV